MPPKPDADAAMSDVKPSHASGSGSGSGGIKKRSPSPPAAAAAAAAAGPTGYRDIPLLSCKPAFLQSKTHLLKFASSFPVDPRAAPFVQPLKLNRKGAPKLKAPNPRPGDPVLDRYGNPLVIMAPDPNDLLGKDKAVQVKWPKDDEEIRALEELLAKTKQEKGPSADASLIAPTLSNVSQRNKARLFQKRVKEVHKASAVARRTWNDERLPWVLEDFDTPREWTSARSAPPSGINALHEALEARSKGLPSVLDVKPEELVKEEKVEEGHMAAAARKKDANHAPWIGKLEGDADDGENHVLFVFDAEGDGGFRVVPVTKSYRFLQKPKHANAISWEEAEKEFEKHQKARSDGASRWMMRARGDDPIGMAGPSSAPGSRAGAGTRVKKEEGDEEFAAVPEWKHLALPGAFNSLGGRARGQPLPVDGAPRDRGRRGRDRDEGTYGEVDFEEEVADDDDHNEGEEYDLGDADTHELAERMKKEMARAEQMSDDEDDDDLFGAEPGRRTDDQLTGSGRQMQKIVRALARNQGNEAYEEDVNPYLSDDSDTEDTAIANPERALQQVREEKEREERERLKNGGKKLEEEQAAAAAAAAEKEREAAAAATAARRSGASTPVGRHEKHASAAPHAAARAAQTARQASAPSAPGSGTHRPGAGHANVAQRATSPFGRPSAGGKSRNASRSGSPTASQGSRATSPMATSSAGGGAAPNSPSSKKRKSEAPGSQPAGGSGGSGHNADGSKRARTATAGTPSRASPMASPSGSRASSPGASGDGSGFRRGGTSAPMSDIERHVMEVMERNPQVTSTMEIAKMFKKTIKAEPHNKAAYLAAITRYWRRFAPSNQEAAGAAGVTKTEGA